MEQKKTNQVILRRKRKFLVILPLLVFPLMTLLLWSFGLIRPEEVKAQATHKTGINMNLPGARIGKDSNWNKLTFYEKADKDSAKYRSLAKNDPNYRLATLLDTSKGNDTGNAQAVKKYAAKGFKYSYDPYPSALKQFHDPNEEKVYKKLAQLNEALNTTVPKRDTLSNAGLTGKNTMQAIGAGELSRAENRLQGLQEAGGHEDPAMKQINGMLEKILDIQHPERITDKIKTQSEAHKQQVFPVILPGNDNISLLDSREGYDQSVTDTSKTSWSEKHNGFYSMEDERPAENRQNAIRATIPEMQTLVTGATVKLCLAGDVYINGVLIPRNEFLYGEASLNGQRLAIHITNIRFRDNIFPVTLSVYDADGMAGIYMPGAITRDVAKQSTDQAIQSMNLATLDQSIGAQAASAGILAAKSLIGKKVKLVKVTVPAGYEVLLRDDNKRTNQ